MRIRFLGNGGFMSAGLSYNCFMIDAGFLVEAPPDLMGSLGRQAVPIEGIRRIFISHFHGDHYFGMPFFVLNLWSLCLESGRRPVKIDMIGPKGIRDRLSALQAVAVSSDNPSVAFIDELFTFQEINESSCLALGGRQHMIFHAMSHSKETYGFSIVESDEYSLTYLADTRWDPAFLDILAHKPRCVICDMNSNASDKIKVHMSEADIVENALPITGDSTLYIGTHLRDEPAQDHGQIQFARVGRQFSIAGT